MNVFADIKIGGQKYMWTGSNIKNIRYDGDICASLNSNSNLCVDFKILKNFYYSFFILLKSEINSIVCVELVGSNKIEKFELNTIQSKDFLKYEINFSSIGKGEENFKANIKSEKNIIVKEIVIKQCIIKNKVKSKAQKNEEETYKNIQKKETYENIRLKKTNEYLFGGNKMSLIGGPKYIWRGKGLKTTFKDSVQCADLLNKNSSIYAKSNVESETEYKVILNALKIGGNGKILVNFFGNINTDGVPISLEIQDANFRDHLAIIKVPKFTPGLQMYLRVWRDDSSTGRIIIKSIQYIKNNISIPIKRKVIKDKKEILIEKKEEENIIKKPERARIKSFIEDFNMKFRPYCKEKKLKDEIDEVLIRTAEDVPMISIITPTRDGADLIKKCYTAIIENTSYPNWEWIVGDSCSNDDTVNFLKSLNNNKIKIIERGTTDGSFSSINNELVKQATGEYLVFLNNDTEPKPMWLYNMISKIHRNPEIGIVGSRLLYPQNDIQHCGIAFIQQGPANIGRSVLKSYPKNYHEWDREYQAVTAACLMIRKIDFNKLKGFDEDYWFCYEDVDLCLRVKNELKKKVIYSANSIVIHNESITQKKHKTGGEKQKKGIEKFKQKWMKKIELDFQKFQINNLKGMIKTDISFVTCISNAGQYFSFVVGSLFKNKTKRNYEVIPIFNYGNKYSAAEALNMGLNKAKGRIVVFCHQDVLFYKNWIDTLFNRIKDIEINDKKWGVLGTAGIDKKDNTIGMVTSLKGKVQWQQTSRGVFKEVQTVDEHCMIIRKDSGLRFDEAMTGFHFYAADLCLLANSRGMKNYGILNPLVHDSNSTSLIAGQKDFNKWLKFISSKWSSKFPIIRTTTSVIKGNHVQTFIKF